MPKIEDPDRAAEETLEFDQQIPESGVPETLLEFDEQIPESGTKETLLEFDEQTPEIVAPETLEEQISDRGAPETLEQIPESVAQETLLEFDEQMQNLQEAAAVVQMTPAAFQEEKAVMSELEEQHRVSSGGPAIPGRVSTIDSRTMDDDDLFSVTSPRCPSSSLCYRSLFICYCYRKIHFQYPAKNWK